uniref:Uncharacterized protein n=1 Tax=Apteryx owenii TaxID=8824 RepID=A0A8B9PTH2_APTOW
MSARGARAIPGAAVRAQKHRTCLTRKLWKNGGRAVCFKAKPSPSPLLSDGFFFLQWSSPPGLRSSSLDRSRKVAFAGDLPVPSAVTGRPHPAGARGRAACGSQPRDPHLGSFCARTVPEIGLLGSGCYLWCSRAPREETTLNPALWARALRRPFVTRARTCSCPRDAWRRLGGGRSPPGPGDAAERVGKGPRLRGLAGAWCSGCLRTPGSTAGARPGGADETFSFKYSPGKLRGNQYKSMMTKEELEEEQRIELTSDLTSL